jgi:hypothetical protein
MSAKRIAAVLLVSSVVALLSVTVAQAATPEWELSVNPAPASFIAGAGGNASEGPLYRLVARNKGAAPTAGQYTLSVTLSEELDPGAEISGKDQKGNPLSCESTGQTVTCTGTEAIAPGEEAEAVIPVDVAADAIGKSAHVDASVAGGGAATVSQGLDTGIGVPVLNMTSTALPSHFVPGSSEDNIFLVATNVGSASSSGPIVLVDTLPAGLTPTAASGKQYLGAKNFSCEISGQTVTCTDPWHLSPGNHLEISIKLDAASLPEGTVLPDQATISGGGAGLASADTTTTIATAPPSFDFLPGQNGFAAPLTGPDGGAATQAGSHPYQLTVNLGFPTDKHGHSLGGAGYVRDAFSDLPRGLVLNPQATPALCTEAELVTEVEPSCPPASQVGTVTITTFTVTGAEATTSALFNMVPPRGTAAVFGFDAVGVGVFAHIVGGVRSNGDYGLSGGSTNIDALPLHPIFGVELDLWGNPTSPSHDSVRGTGCVFFSNGDGACPTQRTDTALITMPADCPGNPNTTIGRADSWEEAGNFKEASYQSADLEGNAVSTDGCNQLSFEPTIEARPTTNVADAPSGLDVRVHQPQDEHVGGLSPAIMKDITLTLPEGMAINPSSADKLGVCAEADANFHSLEQSQCPDSAKVGTVEVTTPLLDHPLAGSLYVAKPFANPMGSLVAVYLAVSDPASGVVANLAGKVSPDPATGQLHTTFTGNPELPIEDIRVHLFNGPRAPLRTPPTCATHTSTAEMTAWSAPETPIARPTDSFATQVAPGGGSCPSQVSAAPNSPTFSAGTIDPVAGSYSPFVLKVAREDASQPLAGLEVTLPPGFSGRLVGIATCSDAQIAAAKARSHPEEGVLEKQSPSCPASSAVGTADVAAGAGPTPLHVQAHAYLAGPYKGAPFSLAIITPAVAGPFDLGVVVVRTALYLDPQTAQIHAVSDPLPQILEGIPLDLRSVDLRMDRPDFTLNPTSCNPLEILGSATSALGALAPLKSHFQVGGCQQLAFKPKLSLRLKGGAKRADHPKLIANLQAKPGEANIASASVQLPRSAFLEQAHIRTICTRVQFAADACPTGSIYGTASATTPLLDYPLTGNVYLRSSSHKLPDLVVALKGPASQPIEIDLAGKTDSVRGALRNTFELLPDAPVSKFHLELLGGKRGLIVNSQNLCAQSHRATVELVGQNGKVHDSGPVVSNDCKAKNHHGHGHRHRSRREKGDRR